jgi:hypothetical protein
LSEQNQPLKFLLLELPPVSMHDGGRPPGNITPASHYFDTLRACFAFNLQTLEMT